MRLIVRLLAIVLLCIGAGIPGPSSCLAEEDHDTADFSTIAKSQNQLIKLSDAGIAPSHLRMKLEDSIVFLLNETTDSLLTLEVDYHGKKTHCATANLTVDANERVRSIRPFGPRDFASVCFHERGDYPLTVYGLPQRPEGLKAMISVE